MQGDIDYLEWDMLEAINAYLFANKIALSLAIVE